MPIEQALTLTYEQAKCLSTQCTDHLGNIYPSKQAMCDAYHIDRQIYFGRIGLGWSVEKALTTPVDYTPKNSKAIIDHLGNEFTSISDMCKFWNMTRSTYNARIKNGWSIERALTEPQRQVNMKRQKWTDHKGNDFPSLNAMCEAYGITHHTFHTRVTKLGWSVEKALTTPNIINATECSDNMGHTFPSLTDMCHYYGIPPYRLQGKTLTEEKLQTCLTSHFKANTKVGDVTVVKCIEFPYYLIKKDSHEFVISFDELVQIYHNDNFHPIPKNKLKDENLIIKESVGFPYYNIEINGESAVWDYWQIIQYRHDSNFGLSSLRKGE
jgi:hypothetical protein